MDNRNRIPNFYMGCYRKYIEGCGNRSIQLLIMKTI